MRTRLMSRLQKTLAAVLLCLASACSVSPEVTFDPGTDFRVDLSADLLVVPQGGRASTGVQITWLGNCGCPDVQLSVAGAPSGMDPRFDAPATATGTTLFVNTTSQVAPGLYRLVVTATRGTIQRSRPLDVQVAGAAPDFALALNPAFLPVAQGGSGVIGIEVQRTGGFAESVSLSLAGAPAGVTGIFSGTPLGPQAAPAAGSATLLLSVAPSVATGPRVLTVQAASASRSHTATFILDVQPPGDFAMVLAPASLSAAAGASSAGPVAITLTRANGFASAVAFSLEGAPAGCSGAFSPASTTGNASSLSLALAGVAPGTYNLTVRGSAGALSHTATLLLTVAAPPPDFALPASVAVAATAGGNGSSGIVISPIHGFSAPVTLSASGLPAGVVASFSPNPATPASGSTITLAVAAAVTPGTYTGSLRGVSGALDHSTPLILTVNQPGDFGLDLSPSPNLSVQVPRGGTNTGSRTVQVQPIGGFAGSVTFTLENLPTGVTGSFSPNPATAGSTLTISVAANALAGASPVTVRGVSGALNHTTTLNLTLAPPQDVTVTLSPSSGSAGIPVSGVATLAASVGLAPVNGFTGSVSLAATGLPAGVTAAFAPDPAAVPGASTMTLSIAPSAAPGITTFQVTATQGPLTASATYTLTLSAPVPGFTVTPVPAAVVEQPGTSGSLTVTVASVGGFSGIVFVDVMNAPPGMDWIVPSPWVSVPAGGSASTTLQLATGSSVPGGIYSLSVRGSSGALVRTGTLQVTVQDFALSASPNAFTFPTGSGISGGGTLAITRQHGLANPISFSATLPGFSFVFTPPSTSGNSAAFTFTGPALFAIPAGVYPVQITGNAGTWTRTAPVTITVQGFLMTLMPSETVTTGVGPSITIQTTPIGGLSGSASIVMVPSGLYSAGFAPMPVALGSSCTWTLTLVTTPVPGNFTLTVNGTSGSHTATRTLNHHVTSSPDYYIHTTDAGGVNRVSVVNLAAGGSASLRVHLNPVLGFAGVPTLGLVSATPGLTAGFAPASIATGLPSTLTLTAAPGLAPGFYYVDVVATYTGAGTITRTATLLVIVS